MRVLERTGSKYVGKENKRPPFFYFDGNIRQKMTTVAQRENNRKKTQKD